MPNFWFALTLVLWLGVNWRLLPITGSASWQNFVMPAIALGYYVTPAIMRLTRAGVLEVLSADYIRTARAKGLRPRTVLFKHALRNAIIPVVSLAAVQFGFMLGGSIVIETIFQINGLGYLAWESIQRKDLPTMQAIVLVLSVIYVLLTLRGRPAQRLPRPAAEGGVRWQRYGHHVHLADSSRNPGAVAGCPAAPAHLSPLGLAGERADPRRHPGDGAAGAAAGPLRSLRPAARPQADPADLACEHQGHLDARLGHRSLGRDYLSRLLYGAQISLLIGVLGDADFGRSSAPRSACSPATSAAASIWR